MLTVHIRINDAATGRPTHARLRITAPDGTVFAPFGRSTEFPTGRGEQVGGHLKLGQDRWVYTDGSCEAALPAGVPLRVQVMKGPEYRPLDQSVTLGPGQLTLRLAVERWSSPRADGWHPGDTRCHFLPPHAARLEAAAEDLDVVNILATPFRELSRDGHSYSVAPDILSFSGQAPALPATDAPLVAVNTLNTHPVLGQVGLLYTHRPVFPLTFGPPDATDDWSLCDWCDQGHRKGGLAVWVSPFRAEVGAGEALVALILGKIDALEYDPQPRLAPLLPSWYRLLNAGFRVPLVGASGKDSNRLALGAVRTYARLAPDTALTYPLWIDAVRAGRTVVTNGPFLSMSVDGTDPGSNIDLPDAQPVAVKLALTGPVPAGRLEVMVCGEVVATLPVSEGGPFTHEVPVTVGESVWVAARFVGAPSAFAPDQPAFAHTSPVYVRVKGRPLPARLEDLAKLRDAVEQTRQWVETQGRFAELKKRDHLLGLCEQALARLKAGERG